jgi:hypothetical protein
MSARISSMPAAGLMHTPPVSKDAFADEHHGVRRDAATPAQQDKRRFVDRAATDGEQAAQPGFAKCGAFQHFDANTRLRQHGEPCDEALRRQRVGRLGHQVAGEPGAGLRGVDRRPGGAQGAGLVRDQV